MLIGGLHCKHFKSIAQIRGMLQANQCKNCEKHVHGSRARTSGTRKLKLWLKGYQAKANNSPYYRLNRRLGELVHFHPVTFCNDGVMDTFPYPTPKIMFRICPLLISSDIFGFWNFELNVSSVDLNVISFFKSNNAVMGYCQSVVSILQLSVLTDPTCDNECGQGNYYRTFRNALFCGHLPSWIVDNRLI